MSPVAKVALTVWEKMRTNRLILIYIAFIVTFTLALVIEGR